MAIQYLILSSPLYLPRQEMSRIFYHIRDDPDVIAVVLSGEGRCFTAGLDRESYNIRRMGVGQNQKDKMEV